MKNYLKASGDTSTGFRVGAILEQQSMPTQPSEAPIACTLGAGDLTTRLAWIAEVNARSLRDVRRDDLRLELTYVSDARDEVQEIIRREQDCCAFLTFDLREEVGAVRVVIEVPERARDTADTVFAPFHAKATTQTARCGCGATAT